MAAVPVSAQEEVQVVRGAAARGAVLKAVVVRVAVAKAVVMRVAVARAAVATQEATKALCTEAKGETAAVSVQGHEEVQVVRGVVATRAVRLAEVETEAQAKEVQEAVAAVVRAEARAKAAATPATGAESEATCTSGRSTPGGNRINSRGRIDSHRAQDRSRDTWRALPSMCAE